MPDPDHPKLEPPSVTYERAHWRLSRTQLAHFAEQLSKRVTGGLAFSCFIATCEALRKLNRDFRNKDECRLTTCDVSVTLCTCASMPANL